MTLPVDDIDRIMAVMNAAFDPQFGEAWNRRQVEDALLIGNCHYGLVDSTGQPGSGAAETAGFFLARTGFEEAELLLLAVDPRYRQRGFGRTLLNEFAEEARARGAKRLLLEMRRSNSAELLYRNFGFLPIGQRPNYYRTPSGDRIDAITFAKV